VHSASIDNSARLRDRNPYADAAAPYKVDRLQASGKFPESLLNTPKTVTVSVTVFLSEPEEYDGGELMVEDLYGSHEVKLPAGDLVLYPASSLHMVTPVTRGRRVASFFWLQSMIGDAHARSLIFDLDTAIQALVERLGRDDPETVKLTGIYHNLIRCWAEV